MEVAGKVIDVISDLQIPHVYSDERGRLSVSVGIATATAVEGFEDLFERADQALYEAKRTGRGRFSVHPAE